VLDRGRALPAPGPEQPLLSQLLARLARQVIQGTFASWMIWIPATLVAMTELLASVASM
jgi:hypothetical protein